MISIDDELDTIRQYEKILQFKDDITAEIHYEAAPELRQLPILKFILQPLVENALKHGFSGWDSGQILIRFYLDGTALYLDIEDDGVGIPTETARQIMAGTMHHEGESFGLRATIERMRLYYGERLHLRIDNQNGTGIHFRIDDYTGFIPDDWSENV